jgi:hypothetical protein
MQATMVWTMGSLAKATSPVLNLDKLVSVDRRDASCSLIGFGPASEKETSGAGSLVAQPRRQSAFRASLGLPRAMGGYEGVCQWRRGISSHAGSR